LSSGTAAPRVPAGRSEIRRLGARVEGTVQGVGFRPFVFRLATELGLAGFVLNDERGVAIEVEGSDEALERFFERLGAEAPPLAVLERITRRQIEPRGRGAFAIVSSERAGEPSALVSPDSATCADCLTELFDPGDRRFRYAFINCTHCGPRFTIVRGVPYDRPQTTMAGFEMCERCRSEYEDPGDRRFHAQPNACPGCGPSVVLVDREGQSIELGAARDPVQAAAAALLEGQIVAVKGIGGFHLACRADDQQAVARLRGRKHREDKPFALMVPDLEAARRLVRLGDDEEALLSSSERPIVLAPRREAVRAEKAVAPASPDLGIMLPYSPLHHLLLRDSDTALVMTSGNVSDEPIAYQDDEALARLAPIADLFLLHDRPIQTRTDDSVLRVVMTGGRRRPLMLRRSRGYVPASVDLPLGTSRHLLACGAEQKNTFCLAKDGRAWVGHHVGDMENFETLRSFRDGIEHFERLFAVAPELIVHDLHPDYLSTAYALEREAAGHLGVQHHHAHLAACLAEHGEPAAPAVGAIYDGTGYGTDGTIWGGEILLGGLNGFERVGHLWPVRLPGGAQAIREPWRMACSWLVEAFDTEEPPVPRALRNGVDQGSWRMVAKLARTGFSSPSTSSIGRLFDAVAALCGLRLSVNYEGQAAVELEAQAALESKEPGLYPLPIERRDAGAGPGGLVLDARVTVRALAQDRLKGTAVSVIAARFHNTLADATARVCVEVAGTCGTELVVLSGGVFQNRVLLEHTASLLARSGLRVLVPARLPPNDGGISYGQAAVATALDAAG
jgi:hydrogenase maturation protein HypF